MDEALLYDLLIFLKDNFIDLDNIQKIKNKSNENYESLRNLNNLINQSKV